MDNWENVVHDSLDITESATWIDRKTGLVDTYKVVDFMKHVLNDYKNQTKLETDFPKPIKIDPKLPNCYIFDLDCTLCDLCDRDPFEWSKAKHDKLNPFVAEIYKSVHHGYFKFVVSSRWEEARAVTKGWLYRSGVYPDRLYMRPNDDPQSHIEFKLKIYNEEIKGKYNVLGIFEDRNSVVNAFRKLGLPVFQFGNGNF